MAQKWGPPLCAKIDIQLFKDQTLGIGSYGKVCRARYGSLPCAAKLIHETLFDPEASQLVAPEKEHRLPFKRFEQECEVLHNLRHPNVIQYLGVYQDPDTNLPVLVMELMDYSLTHFLNNSSQQIPFHIQVNFCHDIALALSFLHANKVIHRDLSSNNVLLISNIRAKVTDFGMATLHVGEQVTCTMCPGTDVYMPPEAVQDKPVYTEKIDCFSLGVLIIQILTGLFPAPGSRQDEMEFGHPEMTKGRKVMISVPEVERRKNHISLIDANHSLLVIAHDCLKDAESDRPSAQQICERVAALKERTEYTDGIKEVDGQEVKLDSLQSEKPKGEESLLHTPREMKELIEAKKKETLRLNKLIHLKDETIAAKEKEIKELKKQLAAASTEKDKELPKRQSYLRIEKEPKRECPNFLTIEASIDKPWYHGVLSQQEAERRMGEMDMNTFLVRESVQDSGNLILSVKNGDKCYHFPIEKGISGKYEILGTHIPFSSVQELVNYYMQNGLPESSGGKLIQLIMPCTSGIPQLVSPRKEHLYTSIDDINDDSNESHVESKEEISNDHILKLLSKVKLRREAAPGSRAHPPAAARRKPPERPPPPYSMRSQTSKGEVQSDYGRCPSTPARKSPHIIVSTSPKKSVSPLQTFPAPPVLLEQCKKLMSYWHKPLFSREEAVSYLLDKDPGWFVVRDSMSVTSGYALTVRMSPEEAKARAQRRLSKENPAADDKAIAHFLIQPDPDGVSLQGWNEGTFKTLPEFIAYHTVEKLCLPCKLVLPIPPAQNKLNAPKKEDIQRKSEEKQAMEKPSMLEQNGVQEKPAEEEFTAVKKLSTKNQVEKDHSEKPAVQEGQNKKDATVNVQVATEHIMHEFKVVHQSCSKACDSCKEMIWQDGLVCQICQATIHMDKESCKEKLSKPCSCSVGGDISTFRDKSYS